jgi:hypothetical protein
VVRFPSGLASASRERLAIVDATEFVNCRIVKVVWRATILILNVARDAEFAIVVEG